MRRDRQHILEYDYRSRKGHNRSSTCTAGWIDCNRTDEDEDGDTSDKETAEACVDDVGVFGLDDDRVDTSEPEEQHSKEKNVQIVAETKKTGRIAVTVMVENVCEVN